MDLRILTPDDAPAMEAYLQPRADSSVFLRSNALHHGLAEGTHRLSGTYAGAFEGEVMRGVCGFFRVGNVIFQAPPDLATDLARLAIQAAGRPVHWLIGPPEQVDAALDGLGCSEAPTSLVTEEILYALALDELRVPAALAHGDLSCRLATAEDVRPLTPWALDYLRETLAADEDDPEMESGPDPAALMRRIDEDQLFVLQEGDQPVAMTGFNAELPDTVQVGGVYTPPALRSRGYAKAAVAGSLLERRARGATRSILFTAEENLPAQRAYVALGYEPVGHYKLIRFGGPQEVR